MRVNPFSKILFVLLAMNFVSMDLNAQQRFEEKFDIICRDRLRFFRADLAKVIKVKSYARKYRKRVKEEINITFTEKMSYEDTVRTLSIASQQDPRDDSLIWINCLLGTNDLVKKLHNIAKKGGKNLDDFSPNWKHSFVNPAKSLGYCVN